ncbi:MAG: hypothetical protein ACKOU6_13000 [Planctomycetota bacterium]
MTESPPQAILGFSITRGAWFTRGFTAGPLLAGALNAVSYFLRSERGGNLAGQTPWRRQALGFPWELWEYGNHYDGLFVNSKGLVGNLLFALLLGIVAGLVTLQLRPRLNRLVEEFAKQVPPIERRLQFSLRGLLLFTTLLALALSIAKRFTAPHPAMLWAIDVAGPWLLIGIAFIPRRIAWQQRAAIVITLAISMIALAIFIGLKLVPSLEFDQVLMAIFVCWTPQCVLVSILISISVLVFHRLPPGDQR